MSYEHCSKLIVDPINHLLVNTHCFTIRFPELLRITLLVGECNALASQLFGIPVSSIERRFIILIRTCLSTHREFVSEVIRV